MMIVGILFGRVKVTRCSNRQRMGNALEFLAMNPSDQVKGKALTQEYLTKATSVELTSHSGMVTVLADQGYGCPLLPQILFL